MCLPFPEVSYAPYHQSYYTTPAYNTHVVPGQGLFRSWLPSFGWASNRWGPSYGHRFTAAPRCPPMPIRPIGYPRPYVPPLCRNRVFHVRPGF